MEDWEIKYWARRRAIIHARRHVVIDDDEINIQDCRQEIRMLQDALSRFPEELYDNQNFARFMELCTEHRARYLPH